MEIIAFTFFINHVVISNTGSYALAANALADTIRIDTIDIEQSLATGKFTNELKNVGLKPVLIQKIKRAPFSVKGALIGLNKDNIQIFEYLDHDTALSEGLVFAKKYTGSMASNKWKNEMHIYVRDNLVIFYMGKDKNILVALNKDMNSLSLNNK